MMIPPRLTLSCLLLLTAVAPLRATSLVVSIRDAATSRPLPARIYLKDRHGRFYHFRSQDAAGSALEFRRERFEASVEIHTIVSPHPCIAEAPPGQYTLTVEHGKEYAPAVQEVEIVSGRESHVMVTLRRWSDVAKQGWFSGETHVHRTVDELPLTMLAEDLNVALPLTYWVTQAFTPPSQGDKNAAASVKPELIRVDERHVIYPMNTEYEISTVDAKPHTLGAVFALNHKTVLTQGAPPVRAIAEQVHAEGGLLDLDKHSWPWSMMLVPVMQIDLFELANNHHWRTEFGFRRFAELPPPYMNVETDERGFTERGWTDFGLENYYTLLNCGFRLKPTAGTASGVHPAPLGFGRVFVHTGKAFSYDAWMKGLAAGRSFVTTGPMLLVEAEGMKPGHVFHDRDIRKLHLTGAASYYKPLTTIEIISAGKVLRTIQPQNRRNAAGAYETELDETIEIDGSTWLAVRCFQQNEQGRVRFAHTAPFHIEVEGKSFQPRREETDYLIHRVEQEIARHQGVLPAAALQEYQSALDAYRRIAETADESP